VNFCNDTTVKGLCQAIWTVMLQRQAAIPEIDPENPAFGSAGHVQSMYQ
jgi:hypothetical protein